jgi:Zn-dependent metalloprotease
VNASNGEVVRVWTQIHSALNRQISDSNTTTNNPGTLVRSEGQGPSGIVDADNAYTFLGDTYNFYFNVHGRDSLNNAGMTLTATVRYCAPSTNGPVCPPPGLAFFNGSSNRMYFGVGYTVDDITAHELTHGVTGFESGLIYTNASGAINESFSDIWGEFVDLVNGSGTDTAAVRWRIGEDAPGGAIRSMTNPPAFSDPDRLFSPFYQQPSNTNDLGGVHKNSGVNNKLCFLLTDGATFNGQTVSAMGITNVARLYYEVQVNLLGPAAGWTELYNALTQAAINIGWNTTDRNNLYRACQAVEIAGAPKDLYVDKTISCTFAVGNPACTFGFGPYITISQGVNGAYPGDILHLRGGNYNEALTIDKILTLQADSGPVTIGQ